MTVFNMNRKTEYIQRFFSKRCSVDIVHKLGKADLKEITEVFGMYSFMASMEWFKDTKRAAVIDLGCGKRPTLALMLAHYISSDWKFYAIDPQLDVRDYKTRNLTIIKTEVLKLEDLPPIELDRRLIICGNHSHAPVSVLKELSLMMCIDYFYCPCCFDLHIPNVFGVFRKDTNIWSPKNTYYYQRIGPQKENVCQK